MKRLFVRFSSRFRRSLRFSHTKPPLVSESSTVTRFLAPAAFVGGIWIGYQWYSSPPQASTVEFESDPHTQKHVHTDHKLSKREMRFLRFASMEYDDVIYMSPMDFIDSLTLDSPRERVYRRVVKESDLKKMLSRTPPFRRGSKDLFRSLDQNGLISYSEYIFLLTLLTKSKSAFKIAFLMFDNDNNGQIDKNEFLTIRNLTSSLRSTRNIQQTAPKQADGDSCQLEVSDYHFVVSRLHSQLFYGTDSYSIVFTKSEEEVKKQDTTLLLHLFGLSGNDKLTFEQFQVFYENLQRELMEIEFCEFARGKTSISPMDFARLILRYTIVNKDDYHKYIQRVAERSSAEDKGVTLEQWARFSVFLNNLEEFTTAVRLYTNADMPVSKPEFTRAVQCTIGEKLDPEVVDLIFRIFDANNDGTLTYSEFLAVMNDRLHRGLKGRLVNPWGWRSFKGCVINELSSY